jgi:hypothetical protein
MEAVYYWIGFIVIWIGVVPIASVLALIGLIELHQKMMTAFLWYRQGWDWQLLPLYVRIVFAKQVAAESFMDRINQKRFPNNTHLRILIRLLNYLYSLRKP